MSDRFRHSTLRRWLLVGLAAAAVALATAVIASAAGSSGTSAARAHHARPKRAEHALSASTAGVRRAIRHVPRRKLGRRARNKAIAHVRQAERAFHHRRFCVGVRALATIRLGGRVRRAVERTLARAARLGVARGCLIRARSGTLAAGFADGGHYPFSSRPPSPNADEEEALPPLPRGPFRPGWKPGKPTVTAAARKDRGTVFGASAPDDGLLSYGLDIPSPAPPIIEPSEASDGKVVLMTVNTYLTYSTDGGRTFRSYIDPAKIFPTNPDGGPCCDQVVQYDPKTDRFFWLLQYWCNPTDCRSAPGLANRLRLAVASPKQLVDSGATKWEYFDITPKATGAAATDWMDHSDMALGTNSLYITTNTWKQSTADGAAWLRFPTDQLATKTSTDYNWVYSKDDFEDRPVQGTGTVGWIAERWNTSTVEFKSWMEGFQWVYRTTSPIPTPPTEDCAAPGPDGHDPYSSGGGCAAPNNRLSGAAIDSSGLIWVAWNGGRRIYGQTDDAVPQPHIEIFKFASDSLAGGGDPAAEWDNTRYYLDAALTATARGRIAITYQVGTSTDPLGWSVGFLNYGRSSARAATGGADADRIGDYYTIRPASPSSDLVSAAGTVITSDHELKPYFAVYGPKDELPTSSVLSLPTPTTPPPPPAFRTLGWSNDIHPTAAPANSNPPGPEGVGILRSGNVLVTDTPNDAIGSFTAAGAATSPFNPEFGGSSTFNLPRQAIQVQPDEVDVSDSFNQSVDRVRMSDHASLGTLDLPSAFSWSIPRGIAISDDHSTVAVADVGDGSEGGGHVNVFSSAPSWPTFKRQITGLHQDEGVAFDHAGKLWVANSADAQLVRYDPTSGSEIDVWNGAAALAAAGQGPLVKPTGVAVDPSGNVWVADYGSGRVIAFTPDGSKVLQVITDAGGTPLSTPVTLAFDNAGALYVTDTTHDRVARYTPSG